MKRDPYPLQWPATWARARSRAKPQFIAKFARDRDAVIRQLRMRGGSHIVITSDLPTRNDGLPYANASCSDPGIAVWWVEKGREHVLACDRWRHVTDNLRAIDMSLEALRGLSRWGASETVERAFAGFATLPPGSGEPSAPESAPRKRPWREVLGGTWPALDKPDLLAIAKRRYRDLIASAHPDRGGSHEVAAELGAALAEAETELT